MTALSLSPLPTSLPSPLNFEAYARAVQQLPFLDEPRERQLAAAWRDQKDPMAAWQLVMAHLRLVVKVVRAQRGYGLPAGDLAQEGTVGLMKAVHRFDPARGIRLGVYALKWIEAEVREYIMRNWRLVRLGSGAAMKKLFFGYRQAVDALRGWGVERDVAPTLQALARQLDLDPAQVAQAQAYFRGRDVSLERPPGAEDENEPIEERRDLQQAADLAPSDPADTVAEDEAAQVQHDRLHQALARLPARDRAIVVARHLAESPKGLAELGREHGVSAERVRQIEQRALAHLKGELVPMMG